MDLQTLQRRYPLRVALFCLVCSLPESLWSFSAPYICPPQGPLLDVGRQPFTFACAWLWRQGIMAPWRITSLPALEGDNCWRGHAAAFLRYLHLPPSALRKGSVLQVWRMAGPRPVLGELAFSGVGADAFLPPPS